MLHFDEVVSSTKFATLQVTEETEEMRFNTGISALMEFVNGAFKWEQVPHSVLEPFILLLAPYAPHLAEELWQVQCMPVEIIYEGIISACNCAYSKTCRVLTLCFLRRCWVIQTP